MKNVSTSPYLTWIHNGTTMLSNKWWFIFNLIDPSHSMYEKTIWLNIWLHYIIRFLYYILGYEICIFFLFQLKLTKIFFFIYFQTAKKKTRLLSFCNKLMENSDTTEVLDVTYLLEATKRRYKKRWLQNHQKERKKNTNPQLLNSCRGISNIKAIVVGLLNT